MDASQIFAECIGNRIKPIVLQYAPYTDIFEIHPYHHSTDIDFEQQFSDLMFDSIVFYAYEKAEIEKEYNRGHFDALRDAARNVYESRVPKTEKLADGLLGELALDSFVKCFFSHIQMLYSRVKYLERYPKEEPDGKRTGHEIKGYDSMLFSVENGRKYMWIGQVKTGEWTYCLGGIKKDISKSVLRNYFSSAMLIMADIMRATSDSSEELQKIIDDINDFCFDYSRDPEILYSKVHDYFQKENITVRIPCLIIADESDYSDEMALLKNIKGKCHTAFDGFAFEDDGLNIEILLLVFPVRNLSGLRRKFLDARVIK
ncbi:MAG: DUF1837 domain-containing protein [Oscillospiraceae bacterium]|nr:DUF1837 domain-containing protein [Oscillospiraceae bacterium]